MTSADLTSDAESLIRYVENREDKGWTDNDQICVQIAQAKAMIAIARNLEPVEVTVEDVPHINDVSQLLKDALVTDGGHHKQWYLERIADKIGISHENEGIAP